MASVYAVPIQPIRVNKPNYDFSPLGEGFEAIRKRRTGQEVGEALSGNDLRGASAAAFSGGDVRTGLALRELESRDATRAATAGRTAAADREARDEKARTYVRNMLASEDPDAPDFAQRWSGHLTRLRTAGYPVGPEYDDPRTGYQQALAEALGPRGVIERRERTRAGQLPTDQGQFVLNEEGELEVQPPPQAGQGGPRGLVNPAAFRPPNPNRDAPSDLSPTPVQTQVPGVTLEPARPAGLETRDARRRRDVEELGPAVTDQSTTPNEVQIQRYWQGVYGRQARAGFRYDRRGREIANTEGDGGRSTTQDRGRLGALDATLGTINDAREAIEQTSYLSRQFSHATDIGTLARLMPDLELGAGTIMHLMSGANVNIPETGRYLKAFTPAAGDRLNTISRKLDHMELLLASMQKRLGGSWTDEDILQLRNQMRSRLSLRPLTMEEHRQGVRRPTSGARPPPGQSLGGEDGFSIRRLD